MSKQASKTMIGGFVVGAVVLAVIAVVIFGSGQFFKKFPKYVLFFQGSVKGLNVGSPVVFRGVRIGQVAEIALHVKPSDLTMTIPVIIELGGAEWIVGEGMDWKTLRPQTDQARIEMMSQLIEKGLRAQLDSQSLVTGQLLIALDFYPDKPARFVGAMKEYYEIPTIPTTFQVISEKLAELDFEELADNVKNTLQGINDLVNSPELAEAITNLNETLKGARSIVAKVDAKADPILTGVDGTLRDTRQLVRNVDEQAGPLLSDTRDLVRHVDEQIDPVASDIRTALQSATATLDQAKGTLARIKEEIGAGSVLNYHLNEALREVSAAARSFRILADYLEQHPEALLKGKTPSGGK